MPATIAGGRGLHGHEIKVSRTDVLAELDDPTKAEPWAQYCSRWWLVLANPRLIDGLDIPDAWGVMAPPSGRRTRSMTVLKPAPELSPHEPGPGIARLAAWQLYVTNTRIGGLVQEKAHLEQHLAAVRQEVATLRAAGVSAGSREAQRVARILAAVQESARDHHFWGEVNDADVVAALVDHLATRDAARAVRNELQAVVRTVRRLVEPFGYAVRDLEKAKQLADNCVKAVS
jgi:hypothetical protein